MIKAGIFDVGGVLLNWKNTPLYEDIIKTLGISEEAFTTYWDEYFELYEQGKFTEEELWKRFMKVTSARGSLPKESLLLREFKRLFSPNAEVFSLAKKIKDNGYPLAILSNTNDVHLSFMRSQNLFELFDVTVFSNEVGFDKPEAEIYEIAVKGLHCNADETFFVDDLVENIEGANALGIHGIVFFDADQLESELLTLGVKL